MPLRPIVFGSTSVRYVTTTLHMNSDCLAFGHLLEPEFSHAPQLITPGQNTRRVRYRYRTHPVTADCPSLGKFRTRLVAMSDASSHLVTSAFNSFSSPTATPLQMCQHHQVYTTTCKCVSIFTIIFKELITQFTTPLDPNMYAKLDRSSGTR